MNFQFAVYFIYGKVSAKIVIYATSDVDEWNNECRVWLLAANIRKYLYQFYLLHMSGIIVGFNFPNIVFVYTVLQYPRKFWKSQYTRYLLKRNTPRIRHSRSLTFNSCKNGSNSNRNYQRILLVSTCNVFESMWQGFFVLSLPSFQDLTCFYFLVYLIFGLHCSF